MRLRLSQLRQIIKEEVNRALTEHWSDPDVCTTCHGHDREDAREDCTECRGLGAAGLSDPIDAEVARADAEYRKAHGLPPAKPGELKLGRRY